MTTRTEREDLADFLLHASSYELNDWSAMELAGALLTSDWLAEVARAAAEEAWHEGWNARRHGWAVSQNPYRAGAESTETPR